MAGPAPCSLHDEGLGSTVERHPLAQNLVMNHQVRTDPSRFIGFSSIQLNSAIGFDIPASLPMNSCISIMCFLCLRLSGIY